MKYLNTPSNIIDITKPPYNADNTGRTDCTKAIRQALDDCLAGNIAGFEKLREKLLKEAQKYDGNIYIGAECGRYLNGNIFMTFPEELPPSYIIYFPEGTYLASDTLSYTLKNLVAPQGPSYNCEFCRNIHILGESKEKTVIRLADNSEGFESGKRKPFIDFNIKSREDKETTNCAQLNTIEDITVDCGSRNPGAVGIRYSSSNCGRIENIEVRAEEGFCGILFDYECEGCVIDVKISGFDYGMKTVRTSPLIMTDIDFSQCKIAGIHTRNGCICLKNALCGDIPGFYFEKSELGRYCVEDGVKYIGDITGNHIYKPDDEFIKSRDIPKNIRSSNPDDWVCVDDFGAVGDGVTDSAAAIEKAMNSGKPVILFGKGRYHISRTIKVPASVQTIDFMYCTLNAGLSIIVGELDSVFDISQSSDETLFIENLMSDEKFCGFFRCFKHSAKRNVVLSDIYIPASLYFNTVDGSEVYFDNCFTLTSHYAQDAVLHRDGYTPVFCRMIPVELHGQSAYARNLNIERGELELLNDNSKLYVDGYKVEGPGTLVKTINGGKTRFNLFNAAWWGNRLEDNAVFEIDGSEMYVSGGHIFSYPQEEKLCVALPGTSGHGERALTLSDIGEDISGTDALGRTMGKLINEFKCSRQKA